MPELQFPDPPLADEVVLLRPWAVDDVPEKIMAFADPSVQRFSWPETRAYTEADAGSFYAHQDQARHRGPFKGHRRDTVMFSLLPGELPDGFGPEAR